MNPQAVEGTKLTLGSEGSGKSVRRTGWMATMACLLAFASQGAPAEDAATDLVAQLDSVARYCSESNSGKDDDQVRAFVTSLLSSESSADLARIRATSDYKRIEQWDSSRLASDQKDAAAACVTLGKLATRKVDGPEHESPRYERPDRK